MKIPKLSRRKDSERRPEVNLDDYFEQITNAELEMLTIIGNEIAMNFIDKRFMIPCKIKGKMMFTKPVLWVIDENPYIVDASGYSFMYRENNRLIREISGIYPEDAELPNWLKPFATKMYKLGKNEFLLDGRMDEGLYEDENGLREDYHKIDGFLRQYTLPLELVDVIK